MEYQNDESSSTTTSEQDLEPETTEKPQEKDDKSIKLPWHNDAQWMQLLSVIGDWKRQYQDKTDVSHRRQGLRELMSKSVGMDPQGLKSLPEIFFGEPLSLMIQKIEEGPQIFANGLPATHTNIPSTIELTKEKTFVIMSLSFFGLFPYGFTELLRNSEYAQCMANYYVRTWKEFSTNPGWMQKPMKIERRVLTRNAQPDWANSTKTLTGLVIHDEKIGIEDLRDTCQVNFADPYPGGTLPSSHGDIVQEEILFLVYPELFITCLLVPRIDSREAILVTGLTRTNKYKGYQWTFGYQGDFDKDTNDISILHMDALPGGERDENTLNRELNKAYIAFTADTGSKPIGTGHWGCGAFGGSHQRKAIIQLIAAAEAGVSLEYTTYGTRHINGFQVFYDELVKNNITVGQLYSSLLTRLGWGRGPIFQEVMTELCKGE